MDRLPLVNQWDEVLEKTVLWNPVINQSDDGGIKWTLNLSLSQEVVEVKEDVGSGSWLNQGRRLGSLEEWRCEKTFGQKILRLKSRQLTIHLEVVNRRSETPNPENCRTTETGKDNDTDEPRLFSSKSHTLIYKSKSLGLNNRVSR